jgi:hypothetical protein
MGGGWLMLCPAVGEALGHAFDFAASNHLNDEDNGRQR